MRLAFKAYQRHKIENLGGVRVNSANVLRVSSVKPNDGCDEVYGPGESACAFVITRGDASEVFDCIEAAFDKTALPIQCVVRVSRFDPVGF